MNEQLVIGLAFGLGVGLPCFLIVIGVFVAYRVTFNYVPSKASIDNTSNA